MPPRFRKKGKGKRKGKGRRKKKEKKDKVKPRPPPLHLLTELYKKLIDAVRRLYEMRVAARKKRLEGWYLTRELTDIKNDNAIYHDYLTDNIEDLENLIEKFMKLIQDIKDAIAKIVAERMAKLQMELEEYEARIAELEKELKETRAKLLEFEALMIEVAGLLARIQELLREIEAGKFDAQVKIRHLTNQFLTERGRLHNHLEEELYNLIKFCRSFLMPILWNFMQKLTRDNACLRWKLARTDDKNMMLVEKREEMMKRRKLLTLEKPYWDIQWAFFKLAHMDEMLKRKKKRYELREPKLSAFGDIPIGRGDLEAVDVVSRLMPSSQLGKDFNVFLVQRLTAAKEAQERHEREKTREEKRFLQHLLSTAQAMKEKRATMIAFMNDPRFSVATQDEDDDWEDQVEEDYDEDDYEEHSEDEDEFDHEEKTSSSDEDEV